MLVVSQDLLRRADADLARTVGAPYARVLCATDLSAASEGAIGLAFALAAPGGVVHVLHVIEPTYPSLPLEAPIHARYAPTPDELRRIERSVRDRLRKWPPPGVARSDVRREVIVAHHANVASEILARARSTNADVVVVGTRGRGVLSRMFLGSVATAVLRRSPVPVVLFHAPLPAGAS
jgi:nucleotide-binding universal stress UspA family protein